MPVDDQWSACVLAGRDDLPQPTPNSQPSLTPRGDRMRERLEPLKDRLAVQLAKISPDIQQDGLRLAQVWPLVIGRQRSRPTAYAVADALRELGWVRRRFYSDSTPSTTLWFPPISAANQERKI